MWFIGHDHFPTIATDSYDTNKIPIQSFATNLRFYIMDFRTYKKQNFKGYFLVSLKT